MLINSEVQLKNRTTSSHGEIMKTVFLRLE